MSSRNHCEVRKKVGLMGKVIGVNFLPACSSTDFKDAVESLEEWFCQHGRWIFACRYDTIQKLVGETIPENALDMKSFAEYSGKPYGFVKDDGYSKSKLFCWLQLQGRMTRSAIFEDSLEAALVNLSIRQPLESSSQVGESEIFAVRIDSLFPFAGTSLEEFNDDRQQCYRKIMGHGEEILTSLIDTNFEGTAEKVVVFPEDCSINEPPCWFVVPCMNKSAGECLSEVLSYDRSKLRTIDRQNSYCICDLSTKGSNWDDVRVMKIFIRLDDLKINRRSANNDS